MEKSFSNLYIFGKTCPITAFSSSKWPQASVLSESEFIQRNISPIKSYFVLCNKIRVFAFRIWNNGLRLKRSLKLKFGHILKKLKIKKMMLTFLWKNILYFWHQIWGVHIESFPEIHSFAYRTRLCKKLYQFKPCRCLKFEHLTDLISPERYIYH